ncbi:NADH dehydrogenase [ubiquinone] 1 beta subcomplex subunit 9-like [Vanessa atalanta]|uniref:NADH dehydrogenase [ubiquinone] 1 beta subcomplex subunit 9-like n=1 Tax=Vanessa atalanta TaxID=42275 RepID=UPI000E7788C5|nr:NADH dehydrogenase [ubiquinone] 1 beta subcomplex subunit 9-like [Vanessa tameamea]XP_047542276.1 NADH dehydrogenase [ubiquinone] 1 beta subcomplex subunit 9-like [Vanessa atalanta]
MVFAPELRTHAQNVCTLYKKAMRQVESYYCARNVVRYQQVILRSRFDANKRVTDAKDQRRLYRVGLHELFMTQHPVPIAKFPRSVGIAGGVAYARVVEPPDWVLDYWHPLEKAQYPEYFKRREIRKCEYIDKWERGVLM